MKKLHIHILLIVLLLSVPVVSSPDFDGTFSVFTVPPFQREFVRFFLAIIFFYLNLYYFLPKFYQKNNIKLWTIMLVSYLFMVFLPLQIPAKHKDLPNRDFHPEMKMKTPKPDMDKFPEFREKPRFGPPKDKLVRNLFVALLPFMFSFLCSLFIYQSRKKQELEEAKAKADLLNLKYQLQPHFLFNVLNSIYSLALTQSEDAPNGILRLSNMMRYVVTESGKDFVPLEKEIQYLKDYIALQLLRTDDTINFKYTENGNFGGLKIAPLILVNFVENAFKYGFNGEDESRITVNISVENHHLMFKVFNFIVNKNEQQLEKTEIGLKNTLQRLKHLYPAQHEMTIENDGKIFSVDLTINLA